MVSSRKKKTSGSRAAPGSARKCKPRPAWDPYTQDHSQFKLSRDEVERRRDLYTSRHQMPGVERLRELCKTYEGDGERKEPPPREVTSDAEASEEAEGDAVAAVQEEALAVPSSENEATTSRLGNIETFDELAHHADTYGKLDPHEILFEYRSSNRAQKIVDNIQQIIDINMSRIDNMMSQMNVQKIKEEVKTIRSDVDDMKETQLVLRDEMRSMRKEFEEIMSTLQRNFQSLLTDKYAGGRTQFSKRQVGSAPYSPSVLGPQNSLNLSDPARGPLPSVPIHARKTPQQKALFVDGDEDDFDLPLYSEMIENQVKRGH